MPEKLPISPTSLETEISALSGVNAIACRTRGCNSQVSFPTEFRAEMCPKFHRFLSGWRLREREGHHLICAPHLLQSPTLPPLLSLMWRISAVEWECLCVRSLCEIGSVSVSRELSIKYSANVTPPDKRPHEQN